TAVVSDVDQSGRRYQFNGWALDSVLEPVLWGSVDANGRPIWTDLPTDSNAPALLTRGRLLGRPSFLGEGVASANLTDVVGFGGDWTQAAWGAVGGIRYRLTTEAAVTINGALTSLFEHNLVAVLAEAEFGFLVNDPNAFVKLTTTATAEPHREDRSVLHLVPAPHQGRGLSHDSRVAPPPRRPRSHRHRHHRVVAPPLPARRGRRPRFATTRRPRRPGHLPRRGLHNCPPLRGPGRVPARGHRPRGRRPTSSRRCRPRRVRLPRATGRNRLGRPIGRHPPAGRPRTA